MMSFNTSVTPFNISTVSVFNVSTVSTGMNTVPVTLNPSKMSSNIFPMSPDISTVTDTKTSQMMHVSLKVVAVGIFSAGAAPGIVGVATTASLVTFSHVVGKFWWTSVQEFIHQPVEQLAIGPVVELQPKSVELQPKSSIPLANRQTRPRQEVALDSVLGKQFPDVIIVVMDVDKTGKEPTQLEEKFNASVKEPVSLAEKVETRPKQVRSARDGVLGVITWCPVPTAQFNFEENPNTRGQCKKTPINDTGNNAPVGQMHEMYILLKTTAVFVSNEVVPRLVIPIRLILTVVKNTNYVPQQVFNYGSEELPPYMLIVVVVWLVFRSFISKVNEGVLLFISFINMFRGDKLTWKMSRAEKNAWYRTKAFKKKARADAMAECEKIAKERGEIVNSLLSKFNEQRMHTTDAGAADCGILTSKLAAVNIESQSAEQKKVFRITDYDMFVDGSANQPRNAALLNQLAKFHQTPADDVCNKMGREYVKSFNVEFDEETSGKNFMRDVHTSKIARLVGYTEANAWFKQL
jgi:hypothetical protein